jgi:uncharacterized protein
MTFARRSMLAVSVLDLACSLAAGTAHAESANPSFECNKASAVDERAICDYSRLAELDQAMTIAFGQVKKEYKAKARGLGKEAMANRHACGADRLCILDQQANAIAGFQDLGSTVPVPQWVGAYRIQFIKDHPALLGPQLPTAVRHCTFTKIASISTRFGEELKPPTSDLDSTGSAVTFANKAYQVSYSYVEALANSHIGDGVLLCLVSIPKNCPPGDNRGREYSGTNLKTKESRILPDSQHMCGGA